VRRFEGPGVDGVVGVVGVGWRGVAAAVTEEEGEEAEQGESEGDPDGAADDEVGVRGARAGGWGGGRGDG